MQPKSFHKQRLIAIPLILTAFQLVDSSAQAQRGRSEASRCAERLKTYEIMRSAYNKVANAYWNSIKKKQARRRHKIRNNVKLTKRDYVLEFPPEYKGPKRPYCPEIEKKKPEVKVKPPMPLPTVSDFLRSAKKEYRFVPSRTTEFQYKLSVARETLGVGLNENQVIGVFSLETGGIGPYARQSGIFITDQECNPTKPRGTAASTALGYVQLLSANSAVVTYYNGRKFAGRLERYAERSSGNRARELRFKARLLKRMVGDIRSYIYSYPKSRRNNWREFVSFGNTSQGYAVHALNLDADIGPLLQVHKLLKIKQVATNKGYNSVNGAQLELMNLVGYGRGLEMMRPVARDVPTSNFFSRGGYFRNPVAENRTAKGLLDQLDSIIQRNMKKCGSIEFKNAFASARG